MILKQVKIFKNQSQIQTKWMCYKEAEGEREIKFVPNENSLHKQEFFFGMKENLHNVHTSRNKLGYSLLRERVKKRSKQEY